MLAERISREKSSINIKVRRGSGCPAFGDVDLYAGPAGFNRRSGRDAHPRA
jgi:hypothetical protein